MEALSFTVKGKTAFFKKPDVNDYAYFTYNNIPKIALLGMLGAIIGLNGNRQQGNDEYPEFYEKLSKLKISIIPIAEKGYFSKKIQVFNNTTGYYNKDSKLIPCTLNYREQWLFDPKWKIYILDDKSIDQDIYNRIVDYLMNKKCIYIPYLGKNDHTADINNVNIEYLSEAKNFDYIDSIFCDNICTGNDTKNDVLYEMIESLPIELDKTDNAYILNSFEFTNRNIVDYPRDTLIYRHLDNILYFF